MKVLVIGNGGREHALCWHLAEHSSAAEVFCAPGSDAISEHAQPVPIKVDEVQSLADFAQEVRIDLTIVGPELPLSLGIVDEFRSRDLTIFGPSRDAAQLESSKVFAKEFMLRHDIPTAGFDVAHDLNDLENILDRFSFPVALKADGLAAGKGVVLCGTRAEADKAGKVFFEERRFGTSGDRVIVEEFLQGEEVSFIALSDGKRLLPMATSKDYKRIYDDDRGPNTGGMGAHSPSGIVDTEAAREVFERVLVPTVEGMRAEGCPFVGFLYAGLMMTAAGPKVLEFNTRLGDPEAQPLLMRLEDDLATLLTAGAKGNFGKDRLAFRREVAACVVLAAEGYPGSATTGAAIEGLDEAGAHDGVEIFHAGTRRGDDSTFEVAGGRVLSVCATGASLRDALRTAYRAADGVRWPGRQMRTDIGKRVVEQDHEAHSGVINLPRDLARPASDQGQNRGRPR